MESLKKTNFLMILCLVLLITGQGTDAFLGELIGGAIGACAATVALPATLTAVGFTSAGIAAGSYAAGMMSASAMASGGGVVAGSTVAVLQSVGAAGLSSSAITLAEAVGAKIGSAFDH